MKLVKKIATLALVLIIAIATSTLCTRFAPELRNYCLRNPDAQVCQEHMVEEQIKTENTPSYDSNNSTNITAH